MKKERKKNKETNKQRKKGRKKAKKERWKWVSREKVNICNCIKS